MKTVSGNEFQDKPTEVKKIFIGGLWEENQFEIHYNEPIIVHHNSIPCPHCGESFIVQKDDAFGGQFSDIYVICPRVVVAYNEGGYNTTGICLDCLLEAIKNI